MFFGKTLNSLPLSTQVYKWVPANFMRGVGGGGGQPCDVLASHPLGVKYLLLYAKESRDKHKHNGPPGLYAD